MERAQSERFSSAFLNMNKLNDRQLSVSSCEDTESDEKDPLDVVKTQSSKGNFEEELVMAAQTIAMNSTGSGIHPEVWLQNVIKRISKPGIKVRS